MVEIAAAGKKMRFRWKKGKGEKGLKALKFHLLGFDCFCSPGKQISKLSDQIESA